MTDSQPEHQPGNNVYTVLAMLAGIAVISATIFLAVRSQQLFGTWNPFSATVG